MNKSIIETKTCLKKVMYFICSFHSNLNQNEQKRKFSRMRTRSQMSPFGTQKMCEISVCYGGWQRHEGLNYNAL